jgi:23S rRNA (adenine2503-C2)-methyltransferase
VESVLMDYHHGHSLCISTQVGCRQGCRFCASTLGGLVRNLTPAEMLDEIYTATADSGHRIDSVVLMGIGEPLDNYDNVMAFLELLSDPRGLNLSLRHVSLSTCGLVDRIYDLAEKKLGLTLSISLHGSNDAVRSASMPINNKWNIDTLLKACRDYFDTTGRRVSFEYALIEGKNDSPEQAKELAARLKGMLCHVNLIPVNPVVERGNRRSSRQAVERFQKTLQACGVNATVKCVGSFTVYLPSHSCNELVFGYDRSISRVHKHKAARAVCGFYHSFFDAALTEKRRLLIVEHCANRRFDAKKGIWIGRAKDTSAISHLW